MSAIGGILSLSGDNVKKSSLEVLCSSMNNRGSDTQNIWNNNCVGMVHKQLWTTLESQHEDQPLVDDFEDLVLTADARIDNRDEMLPLLNEYLKNKHIVTDADIILASYKEWNESCVDHLIGDFSFAIWDKKEEKLFCARDHLGIKPFNYIYTDEQFGFSSEINALILASGIEKKLNVSNAKSYIERYKIAPDATFFKQVKRLIPGHTLSLQRRKLIIQRYWFPELISINEFITLEDAAAKFHTLIEEATRVRLRNAYEVGCEVSGGLDSSTILTLALKHNPDVVPFASIYGDFDCDESEYIRAITEKLNVSPVISHSDQLDYKNSDSLTNYYVMANDWPGKCIVLDSIDEFRKAEQRNVRVMLTGHGGDQVSSGHPGRLTDYFRSGEFRRLYQEHKYVPFNKRIILSYFIYPFVPNWAKNKVKSLLGRRVSSNNFSYRLDLWMLNKKEIFHTRAQRGTLEWLYGDNNTFWMDINPYNVVAGCFDIEARHPFFDKRVVEFMLSLPQWLKNDGKKDKITLREAMKSYFPDIINKRKDKAEFTSILYHQLKEGLKEGKHCSVSFDSQTTVNLMKIQYNNKDDVNDIWKQICLSEWIKTNNLGTNHETKK